MKNKVWKWIIENLKPEDVDKIDVQKFIKSVQKNPVLQKMIEK